MADDMRCRIEPDDHEPFANKGARSTHERMKHSLEITTVAPQLPLEGPSHAQDDKIDALTAEVADLVKTLKPATPPAAHSESPTLASIVAHCQGGTCAPHAKELEDYNAGVIRTAWDNIPRDVVKTAAEKAGILPTKIVFEPAKAAVS